MVLVEFEHESHGHYAPDDPTMRYLRLALEAFTDGQRKSTLTAWKCPGARRGRPPHRKRLDARRGCPATGFLKFVTGLEAIPVVRPGRQMGDAPRPFKLLVDGKGIGVERFITSSTCYAQLHLPPYASAEEVEGKLALAIEGDSGFGVE